MAAVARHVEMLRAASIAKEHGYEVTSFGGDRNSIDLAKWVPTGHGDCGVVIGLTLCRKPDYETEPRWNAEVHHLPIASMVVVRSLSFSWPHKSFERLFELPVIKMALLYDASKTI